jgi:hypothetical protein
MDMQYGAMVSLFETFQDGDSIIVVNRLFFKGTQKSDSYFGAVAVTMLKTLIRSSTKRIHLIDVGDTHTLEYGSQKILDVETTNSVFDVSKNKIHLVYMDDGSYSGSQIVSERSTFLGLEDNKRFFTCNVVLGIVTEMALSEMKHVGFQIFHGKVLKTVEQLLPTRLHHTARRKLDISLDKSLVTLSYKQPDGFSTSDSFLRSVLEDNMEKKPFYKKGGIKSAPPGTELFRPDESADVTGEPLFTSSGPQPFAWGLRGVVRKLLSSLFNIDFGIYGGYRSRKRSCRQRLRASQVKLTNKKKIRRQSRKSP